MHLITMAHSGEAQGVIESFRLKKISEGLFQGEDFVLLITGEGPFEASTKTALTLPKFPFENVLNLGIAGTLDDQFKKGEIHPVRTIYLVQDLKPQFKTFQSFEMGLDCITSFERILDTEKAKSLRGIGTLVDREAWGVAMAAKTAGIPFHAYKLISDVAGTKEACEVIREEAVELAGKISTFLRTMTHKESTEIKIPDFYFTFTSEHQFRDLLKKLSLKDEVLPDEILATLPLNELRDLEITPKERAKKLLQVMEKRIDPVKTVLNEKKTAWTLSYEKAGIKIQTDPHWENQNITISFEVSDDETLKKKIAELQSLSLKPFHKLMNGDFHVE